MMTKMKTLKLVSSFRPVAVIDAVEALVLCIIGKAKSIELYNNCINSVSESFQLPAVIVLNRYVKFRYTSVACNRKNVFIRDNHQCQYCGQHFKPENLTLDHVVPKSKGGGNSWKNIVTACKCCNQKKGNSLISECGMRTLKIPKAPKVSVLRMVEKDQINPQWKNYLWDFS